MDKSWINEENRVSARYLQGVIEFIGFALKSSKDGKLACPCVKCVNTRRNTQDVVIEHLLNHGFSPSYTYWHFHGESCSTTMGSNRPRPTQFDRRQYEVDTQHNVRQFLEDIVVGHTNIGGGSNPGDDNLTFCAFGETSNIQPLGEKFNEEAEKFYRILRDTDEKLFDGCKNHSKLSFILDLFHKKCMNGWSNKAFKDLLDLLRETFPGGENLPKSSYEVKKLISELGLGYEKIDVCPNNCMLFWKDRKDDSVCSICGASRWVEDGKPSNVGPSIKTNKKKKKPKKILRWFPLKPRLQRYFMCSKTASLMRWHYDERIEDGFLRYPVDARAMALFSQIAKRLTV